MAVGMISFFLVLEFNFVSVFCDDHRAGIFLEDVLLAKGHIIVEGFVFMPEFP